VAFRLQQGLKKSVQTDRLSSYILYVWNNSLKHHFWQEEKSLSPVMQNSDQGEKLLAKMNQDHQSFRSLIARLSQDRDQEKAINEFADLLNRHIRFEERELFTFLQQSLSVPQLNDVGKFLHDHHQPVCDDWQPRFWEQSADRKINSPL
jgi:hemerythrin-like domain-containing protein